MSEIDQDEPLTLYDLKLYLRIDHDDDDEHLQDFLIAAREYVETATGLDLKRAAADPEPIPRRAAQAIRLLVSHWYEIREPVVVGVVPAQVPFSVSRLINQLRDWTAR